MIKKLTIGLSVLLAFNIVITPLSAFAVETVQEQNSGQDLPMDVLIEQQQDGFIKDNQSSFNQGESSEQQDNMNIPITVDKKQPREDEQYGEKEGKLKTEEKLHLDLMNNYTGFQVNDNGDGTASITGYNGTDTELVIPSQINGLEVVEIADAALKGKGFSSVTIEGNIKRVGKEAFYNTNLNSITFHGNIDFIDESGFGKSEVGSFTVEGSVGTFGEESFLESKIGPIKIKGNIDSNLMSSFFKTEIGDIEVGGNWGTIGNNSFAESNIGNLIIRGNVTKIDDYSFRQSVLKSFTVDGDLNVIESYSFMSSTLENILIKGSLDSIGDNVFLFATAETFTVYGTVNLIDQNALQQSSIKAIEFKDKVNTVDNAAFMMGVFNNITFHSDIDVIKESSFLRTKVDYLEIKGNVNVFEPGSFLEAEIPILHVNGNVKEIKNDVFLRIISDQILFGGNVGYVGNNTFSAGSWGELGHIGELIFKGDIINVDEYGFLSTHILNKLVVEGDIGTIGESAFTAVDIPLMHVFGDIGSIAEQSFVGNIGEQKIGSKEIIVEGKIGSVGLNSFVMFKADKFIVKGGIENIGNRSFQYSDIKELDIFTNNKNIEELAFYKAKFYKEIEVPNTNIDVGMGAFMESEAPGYKIDSVYTTSKEHLFELAIGLKEFDITDTITKIENYAFKDTGIKKVKTSKNLESVGEEAFLNHNLSCVTLYSKLNSIGKDAFKSDKVAPEDFTIWGDKGSVAESYALANGHQFKVNEIFTNKCNPAEWAIEVEYVDEQGNLLDSKTINKPAKGNHTENAKLIPGYTIKNDKTVTVEVSHKNPNHTIIFTYSKNPSTKPLPQPVLGTVTVMYVDENKNVLESKTVSELPLGKHTEYAKEISGYEVTVSKLQTVEITTDTTHFTIIFTYKRIDTSIQSISEPTPAMTLIETQEHSKTSNEDKVSQEGKRVIRDEGNGLFTTVPHYLGSDVKLKITTKYNYGLLITDRISVPFNDIKGLYSYQEVEDLYNYLIVNGTTTSTYSPNKDLKRGEFSAMIARALELRPNGKHYQFSDVDVYKKEVQALYEAKIITGYTDGTFGEGIALTRQEAAAMIVRMLEHMGVDTTSTKEMALADMNQVSSYAKEAVQYLAEHDVLISGQDTYFKPLNNLTRAQMAKVLMRSLRISDWY